MSLNFHFALTDNIFLHFYRVVSLIIMKGSDVMILLQEPRLSYFISCPYVQEEECRFEYFYANSLDCTDLDELLKLGWRKFGEYYFRPCCGNCRRCLPLRILTREFKPTKTQRRVTRKCAGIEVRFGALDYKDEIFDIYLEHSRSRFGLDGSLDEFYATFYTKSCPTMQSEYYMNGTLIAVGFIDIATESLSSVYFAYRSSYDQYRLGTFSVLKEVEYAAAEGLKYYYLGYYIKENPRMAYKSHFHPYEYFDWHGTKWIREGGENRSGFSDVQ
jgi:arginyl-tRNA--protein-N-Asp/Glu arginylyltransferase